MLYDNIFANSRIKQSYRGIGAGQLMARRELPRRSHPHPFNLEYSTLSAIVDFLYAGLIKSMQEEHIRSLPELLSFDTMHEDDVANRSPPASCQLIIYGIYEKTIG
jgi:hypothetical protein